MKPISVVGAGLCFDDLTAAHLKIVESSDVLVGGKRHLAWFGDYPGIKREIVSPLSDVIEDIRRWAVDKKVAVLASGDPLFFGIGQILVKKLGPENVVIFPNIGSMAGCFARLKETWRDAAVVSLHGKDRVQELERALWGDRPIFLFTDPEKDPSFVGRTVEGSGTEGWRMFIFERLGAPDERVRDMSPGEAANAVFMEPNAVVLKKDAPAEPEHPLVLGAPDHWYEHERGLITKAEVRAVSISKLRLDIDHVFWDLGAGSGSVSVEAAMFVRRGRIFAVEKKASRIEQIRANTRKFGVGFIETVQADLPEGLDNLPSPNRVFIGGGGEGLGEIVRAAAERLLPQGRIVVNTVLIETFSKAVSELDRLGFETETVQVQINEGARMSAGTRFAAKNPVWIVSAQRKN